MGLEIEMRDNGNRCAYPDPHENLLSREGLTKRELLAAMAMQSLGFPAQWLTDETGRMQVRIREEFPRLAVEYADALLAALEQQEP